MADDKPKPHPVPKQRKFKIYQCLFNLNVAFESIGREIEALDDYQTVPRETLWRCRVIVEEVRAGLNHRILEVLTGRELKEWMLFGREIRARRRMVATSEEGTTTVIGT